MTESNITFSGVESEITTLPKNNFTDNRVRTYASFTIHNGETATISGHVEDHYGGRVVVVTDVNGRDVARTVVDVIRDGIDVTHFENLTGAPVTVNVTIYV